MHSRDILLIWLSWKPRRWLQQWALEQRLASCWWEFDAVQGKTAVGTMALHWFAAEDWIEKYGLGALSEGLFLAQRQNEGSCDEDRRGQARAGAEGQGLRLTRPGLQFQGPVPAPRASAKQPGRCPADVTPPQGRNCRAPVTRAAQIEVSSPESRCSPIFCMRWCRVGIQPVDKWLQFRLQFGWAKETVVCESVCVYFPCVCERQSDYVCVEHCRSSLPLSLNDAVMLH